MLNLLRFLKPYWKLAILAPLMMVVEVVMDLYQPRLLAAIIDQGIPAGDMEYILRTSLVMLIVALVGMGGGVGCTIAASKASQNYGADLRAALFDRVQAFSSSNLDRFGTSSLIIRLTNDVTQVQNIVMMGLRIMVRAPLLGLGGLAMALSINPRLSLILVVVLPLVGLGMVQIVRRVFPLFEQVQKRLDRVNTIMRENLAGARVVKAFVRSRHEERRFKTANESLMTKTIQASRLVVLGMPLIMLGMNMSVVAVLWLGGIQVHAGTMQVGEVMAFIEYLTFILFSLGMVTMLFVSLSRASASAARINEVLEEEVTIRDSDSAREVPVREGRVEFRDVNFSYPGDRSEPVLEGITFTARPGEMIAILGGTGVGKSTLVNLIPRLYEPTSGAITIDGRAIQDYSLHALRQGISMVPQETILFSGPVRENIAWGNPGATEEEIQRAARMAQAHDFIVQLPDGYDTRLEQRAVTLSGGQKQRIALARGLVKGAKILILDDSTSAVDMATEARIQQALRERVRITTFTIAQRISSVMAADMIMVLEDGRITARGSHEELLYSSDIYRELYESQFGEREVS